MNERDAELAAALAAVDAFLRAEANERDHSAAQPQREQAAWHEQARLAGLGIATRDSRGGWSVAERLRRGAGGFYGVIGL